MRKNLTDITLVLDRSGSMKACKDEAENGVNHFIKKQKEQNGECNFSLLQFDTEYEFIHQGIPITEVPQFTLVPRGMTALLDAVGRAVNETGERLAAMEEHDRPELVVFVIVTDGQENSSQEFTKTQIKEMITRQQNEYGWQFTFLGANQDAFAEAGGLGISVMATANYTGVSSKQAFDSASANVSRMRCAVAEDQTVINTYTESERKVMRNMSKE